MISKRRNLIQRHDTGYNKPDFSLLFSALFCCCILFLAGCKKSERVLPQEKGSIRFENLDYPLHNAIRSSYPAYAINNNGTIQEFYGHSFILSSSDSRNRADIRVISDDQTLISGEYFLTGFSANTHDGKITLDLTLNKYDNGSILQSLKINVLFQNEKLLEIDFSYSGNPVYINWDGEF